MPNIEVHTINDFRIILNYDKTAKTTMVQSFISNGFINEDKENAGISHLLEHVVTEGWKRCGKKGCTDYWKKRGVFTNASTGQTNLEYYMNGLEKYSKEMIDYITSISINPVITKYIMDKEKKAVQNELMINSSHPLVNLFNLLNDMLFRLDGLIVQDNIKLQFKNLKTFTVEDMKSWCKRFYGAGNVIFVISGKFPKTQTLDYFKKKLKNANSIRIIPKYSNIFKQGLDIRFLKNNIIDNTNILFAFHCPIYQKDLEIFYIDFFKEFIGSGVSSMLMTELREKRKLIYNIQLDHYITPYGTYLTIEISTKNKNIEEVIFNTVKILKKLSNGKFSKDYLENVKKAYMVEHYSTCQNNSFITDFYGQQYINQLYNVGEKPNILSFKKVSEEILKLTKMNFVLFVKRLLTFSNMKIAYQGKREVKNLQSLVLKRI